MSETAVAMEANGGPLQDPLLLASWLQGVIIFHQTTTAHVPSKREYELTAFEEGYCMFN